MVLDYTDPPSHNDFQKYLTSKLLLLGTEQNVPRDRPPLHHPDGQEQPRAGQLGPQAGHTPPRCHEFTQV